MSADYYRLIRELREATQLPGADEQELIEYVTEKTQQAIQAHWAKERGEKR